MWIFSKAEGRKAATMPANCGEKSVSRAIEEVIMQSGGSFIVGDRNCQPNCKATSGKTKIAPSRIARPPHAKPIGY